jgi:hypothetical protein
MDPNQAHHLLAAAEAGVTQFLESARARGDIDQQAFQQASQNVVPNLRKWLTDD